MPIKIVPKKTTPPTDAPVPKAPEPTVEVASVIATTTKSTHHGKTELTYQENEEHVGDVVSEEPLANVGISASRTINLGNYNAAKISVSLHYPCKIGDIDKTYEIVKEWVDVKMSEIMSEATSGA